MKVCINCGQRFDADDWRCSCCGKPPELHNGYLTFLSNLPEKNYGFNPELFIELAKLEAEHFWFNSRKRLLLWVLNNYFSTVENFMEIGCGTGFVLSGIHQEFPEWTLSGSDYFAQGLDYAKARVPSASFFLMDACRIPFREEFDVIGTFDVLEHIEEDRVALSEIFKSLKKNGRLILTVPQHKWLWSILDEIAYHKRRYSRAELVRKLKESGFRIVLMTSFVSLLLPVMILSRLRSLSTKYDQTLDGGIHLLQIHPNLNSLLEKICHLEKILLNRGAIFPLGGSLLCVCAKS